LRFEILVGRGLAAAPRHIARGKADRPAAGQFRMSNFKLPPLVCVFLLWGTAATAQPLPAGQVIERVATLADPAQTYALYLPTSYTSERIWPILIGFHPGARGRAIVDAYREAAERHGFIVAGSNVSRNGPFEASWQAARTMLQDIGQRLPADARRVYLTGHSGGARLALQIALANAQIAGVIASSAGFPDSTPRSSVSFPIFGTAGTEDFNHVEMRLLDRALKTSHRLAVFEGGHVLPPPDVAMQALDWLDLQAMASGRLPRDASRIGAAWADAERAAAEAGETARAVHLLRGMAVDFKDLHDIKAVEARASALARQPAVKRALDDEREGDERERRMMEDIGRLRTDVGDASMRAAALKALETRLSALKTEADAPVASAERARARRILRATAADARAAGEGDAEYRALIRRYAAP
jgi:hypothetical protein